MLIYVLDEDHLRFQYLWREPMNNVGLYLTAVLIWGSTWLAITFQLVRVPPEVSVA